MSTTSRQPQDPAAGSGPTLFRVGLTGGIGSGKSTVADRFVGCGAVLVDTDVIAHRLTAPGGPAIEAIRRQFGNDLIAADGSMARAAMRAHVFAVPQARKTLESILHPMIRADSQRAILAAEAAGAAYVLLAIPLLVESGAAGDRVDRVLVVDCPVEVQIRRVMTRSGLCREAVEAIIAAQASRRQRLDAADDVIDNSGDVEQLDPQVSRLHCEYLSLAASQRAGGAGSGTQGLS
ncbi:MAG: dephospho-CoA kinase [Lautropia sp.]